MTATAALRQLSIGQRVRWAREKKGISQERLAERAGTTRRHVMRIEKGQHKPRPDLVARIAEATDQQPTFFSANGADDDEESDPVAVELVRALMKRVDEKVEAAVNRALERQAW